MDYKNAVDELALRAFDQVNTKSNHIVQLLTKKERIHLGRRILIAQAIIAGKTRYEINNHIHISPNTFTQVKRWLESQFSEAYTSAHQAPNSNTNRPKAEHIEPFTYQHLKRTYPGHFLLFSLVEELFSLNKK